VTIEVQGNSLQKLIGRLNGPRDTPFEGGVFYVDIQLDDQYPFVPPKMRFITKLWHPNISSANGAICLDILKDQWSPALTLKTALLSLQALLSSPQPDDPQDAVVARQYLSSLADYQATAKQWTQTYAHAVSRRRQLPKWCFETGKRCWHTWLANATLTHTTCHLPSSRPAPLAQQQVVGLEAKVQAIAEMGFGREQALEALRCANGDEQQAMEYLLGA
jgi:ubiquitin-conjugating enzyme (huntingtin interacting protein 2)